MSTTHTPKKPLTIGALSATLAQLESVYGPDALMADLPESAKAMLRGEPSAYYDWLVDLFWNGYFSVPDCDAPAEQEGGAQ